MASKNTAVFGIYSTVAAAERAVDTLGLRGLKALPVHFRAAPAGTGHPSEGRT